MQATVVICTRNRAESLRRTLARLIEQDGLAQGRWNILVVNNGSTDATPRVIGEFARHYPVREAREPRPGLSHARNRGIAEADGEHVIWTDDDTLPAPGWVTAYLDAFARHPDLAIFGGPITAVFEDPHSVPDWMAQNLEVLALLLTVRDPGPEELEIPNERGLLPFTANAAVRRSVALRFPFDPELGYAPGRSRGGEEMDVFDRMIAAGHRGAWVPGALLEHQTTTERQTLAHVERFYRGVGETSYLRRSVRDVGLRHVATLMAKRMIAILLFTLISPISPARSVWALTSASYHAGALAMLRNNMRATPRTTTRRNDGTPPTVVAGGKAPEGSA